MNTITYQPNKAIHPGETLKEILDSIPMSQTELAMRTGLTPKTINEIVRGKAVLTTDTAIKLSVVFGMSTDFWNNLERNYQEDLSRIKIAKNSNPEMVRKIAELIIKATELK